MNWRGSQSSRPISKLTCWTDMIFSRKKKKVLLGMSGGIDSSMSVYYLQKSGYDVTGITFRLAEDDTVYHGKQENVVQKAANVCSQYGIDHIIANYRSEFNNCIIRDFTSEYFSGRTPNPCVRCNRSIKWKYLIKNADALGHDYIATGHYANIDYRNGRWNLLKGKDPSKDQSYFLWNLSQESLSRTIFPLGRHTKSKIRKVARRQKLPFSQHDESQDICF